MPFDSVSLQLVEYSPTNETETMASIGRMWYDEVLRAPLLFNSLYPITLYCTIRTLR